MNPLDRPPSNSAEVLREVASEVHRSTMKHGDQTFRAYGNGSATTALDIIDAGITTQEACLRMQARVDAGMASGTVTWLEILAEEFFEAAATDTPIELRAELIQVAAVAVKFVNAIDNRTAHGDT